jgi:hypothetical protein
MWKGYGRVDLPDWLFPNLLAAMSLIGLLYGAMRKAKAVEFTFWTLLWASIVASSSVVYLEEGPRVLAASHPMMALFFALGMSSFVSGPAESASRSRLSRNGIVGLIAAGMLFACVPWMAYRLSPMGVSAAPPEKPNEAFVFGGRRMSGFLVIDDDLPLRDDIPSLHLADFAAILRLSGVESYLNLMHPTLPPLPFGFVFAPRLEKGSNSAPLYIVPAEVVERREVAAWHFDLKQWGDKQNGYGDWFYVTTAKPLP